MSLKMHDFMVCSFTCIHRSILSVNNSEEDEEVIDEGTSLWQLHHFSRHHLLIGLIEQVEYPTFLIDEHNLTNEGTPIDLR